MFAVLLLAACGAAEAQTTPTVKTDATWRTTSTLPPAGWSTSLTFDDSAAGWQGAFKSPAGDNIWYGSNQSSQSPDQAWFRHTFTLDRVPTQASGTFFFDDNGEAYINGQLVLNDTGGGATTTSLTLDPRLFVAGDNLVALHGIDTAGPFSNVSVNLFLAPELACLSAALVPLLLLRRRPRQMA